MGDLAAMVLTLAGFGAVVYCLARLTARGRTRRLGGAVTGPFEEIWHPAAHRARITVEQQDERKVAMPSPGDPPV